MLVISNNLVGTIKFPKDSIVRLNLAWVKDVQEAKDILDKFEGNVYLDFPSGRTKPPMPKISIGQAVNLSRHKAVKYFAMSNCENPADIKRIMKLTPAEVIPKIETKLGVKNMQDMVEVGVKTFMLDKDDLWIDVNCDTKKFLELIEEARKFNIIEMRGVVFY